MKNPHFPLADNVLFVNCLFIYMQVLEKRAEQLNLPELSTPLLQKVFIFY